MKALPLLLLLALARPALAAEPPGTSVADLVGGLDTCESIDTCEPVRALVARGRAVWPALEVGLTSDKELVRFWTLGVLSEVTVPEARDAITARLGDKAVRVRAAAAFALGALGGKEVTPALLRALLDKDLNVRFAATVALGRVKDPASVQGLIAALRDKDNDVRAQSAQALGEIGDAAAAPALLERLDQDLIPEVRTYAATALAEIAAPDAAEKLIAHLTGEQDPKALAATAYALGRLHDPRAKAPLERLLASPHEEVRVYAKEALEALRMPQKKKAPRE